MPPIEINIKTKIKGKKFLKELLSDLSVEVTTQVTDFIEKESKEMANGHEIYNVPESPGMRDRIKDPLSLANNIEKHIITDTQTKVISTAEHSSWVEWGTGLFGELEPAHYIYPRKASAMTWINKLGTRVIVSRTKGQYPKPFMRGAIYKLKAKIKKVIEAKV